MNMNKTPEFICAATSFLMSSTLSAATIPPLNVSMSSGSNNIPIYAGQVITVEYLLQNLISRPKTWVWSAPIPSYITQTTSLHQPDCSTYNQTPGNPNSFTIPQQGSCYLAMQVNGTEFVAQGNQTAIYKPIFTNSDGVAYSTCENGTLNISRSLLMPPVIAAGTYESVDGIRRPQLTVSQNLGIDWFYPEVINAPVFTPDNTTLPFVNFGAFNGTSCSGTTCIAVGQGEDTTGFTTPLLAVSQDSGTNWRYPTAAHLPEFVPGNPFPFGYANINYGGFLSAASCEGDLCIASGRYQDDADINRPMIVVSNDSGGTWRYPASATILNLTPAFSDDGELVSASCSGNICIAAGRYTAASLRIHPLIAYSNNSGDTWSYPNSVNQTPPFPVFPIPAVDNGGALLASGCSSNTCIAVGYYTDIGSIFRPLLARTLDAGLTWDYPASLTTPVFTPNDPFPFSSSGYFYSASCNGNICIATGTYTSITTMRPMLALSKDSGVTWEFPASITDPVFTPDNTYPFVGEGSLDGASCNGNICVAAGSYEDADRTRPLIALSQDAGNTWSYPASVTNPVFTPSNTNAFVTGAFTDASCNQSICIATGFYSDNNTDIRPLLAYSTDAGTTWTFPSSIPGIQFSPVNTNPYSDDGVFRAAGANDASSLIPNSLKFIYPKNRSR